jgi:uncharacterized protein (TIGR00369 family)
MSALDATAEVPDGYELLLGTEIGFNGLCGPFWVRTHEGAPVLGFRVEDRHLNPSGMCHGGALAAFADYLAVIVRHLAQTVDRACPTVTLSIDFIAPIPRGAWVELHGRLLRRTKTLLFGEGQMRVDGVVMTRVDGIFILGRPRAEVGYPIPPGRVSAV